MIVSKNAENSIKLYIYIYINTVTKGGICLLDQVYLDNNKIVNIINRTRLNL